MKSVDGSWRGSMLAVMIAVSGCHSRPTVQSRSGASTVAGQPVDATKVVAPGIVEAWGGEIRVAANELGQIAEVRVREGDVVAAGAVLIVLDDGVQRHAVELARAELREAISLRNRALRGATAEDLALARAEQQGAAARSAQASRDAARFQSLGELGGVPLADAERALSEARGQAAWLSAADARLGAIVRGPRVEERDAALARTAAAEARLAGAQTALARRSVVSPCDGTVLWSRWHAGELFGPSAGPLVVLGDMQRLQIRLEVDELDAAAVSIGASCEVFTDIGEGVASCKVDRVAPAFGRRSLLLEAPSSRTDVRIREVFVEVRGGRQMAPGQRLWVHVPRAAGSPQ